MPSCLHRVLMALLCTSLGCSGIFSPFRYRDPNNCALDPGSCGAGLECNFNTETCEPAAALPTLSRPIWQQQAKLTAGDGATGDALGFSLSIAGETALIGAQSADVSGAGTNDGAAYVFVRDPNRGTWAQQAKLVTGDPATGDLVGFAVSLFADTALVSAHTADPGGLAQAGAAYVFVRNPSRGTWAQQAKLVADDGMTGDLLGRAVAISGDTALIGANQVDAGGNTNSGAAYVFLRSPATGVWAQQHPRLVPGDSATGDEFGISVSVSADTALVGAYLAGSPGKTEAGAAYVFVRNPASGAWVQQTKLLAADSASGDHFGLSVALSGDLALIGAPDADPGGRTSAGAAYVFVRNPASGVWTQQAKLVAANGVASDIFGSAVALSGSRAAVTARLATFDGQAPTGAVYLFTQAQAQGTWVSEARLVANDAAPGDSAGFGVSLSGDTLGLGASGVDLTGKMDVGAGYIFQYAKQNGDPCAAARECHSFFCVDGVCCDSACGGSDPTDCQACSAAAGAILSANGDGTCRPRRIGQLCRASTAATDPAESCDGQLLSCPLDVRQ